MENIRGARLRKFNLRKIILGVRMHFRHKSRVLCRSIGLMVCARATGNFESRKFSPLRAKIPENFRYLIAPYTQYTLSANINLTNSHHLSIANRHVQHQ